MCSAFGRSGRKVLTAILMVIAVMQVYIVLVYNDFGFGLWGGTNAENISNRMLADLLNLNSLNVVCINNKDVVISWKPNKTDASGFQLLREDMDHAALIKYLSDCHVVDIFLPKDLRSHGYCEDGMAYVQYLKARALPRWVLDMKMQRKDGKMYYAATAFTI
jgi:hypothetical protein